AWAMGETGDPRFAETLRRLLNEQDQTVRKLALAALSKLKSAASQSTDEPVWQGSARFLPSRSQNARRLMVAIAGEDAVDQPRVGPVGFLLNEGGSYVTSYQVTERPPVPAMSVVFVLPRERSIAAPFYSAVERCLKWKRTSDLWWMLP